MRVWMLGILGCLWLGALGALAQDIAPRAGWEVRATNMTYGDLVGAVWDAAKASPLAVVTRAGPTQAAARRGIKIPGNQVLGLFNNDFAVRVLALSGAAMIEAPVRLYVTEGADGGASLSWKRPSYVFAPYLDEGGADLQEIALELDALFVQIADAATGAAEGSEP